MHCPCQLVHGTDARPLCRDILPSDLQYLTDENIEEIGGAMTHVEKMRMQAALQALCGACGTPHLGGVWTWEPI